MLLYNVSYLHEGYSSLDLVSDEPFAALATLDLCAIVLVTCATAYRVRSAE